MNTVTGAVIGGAAAVTYILAAIATEIAIGRPSPTQMAGTLVFGLPFLGGLGVLVGAVLGWVGRLVVRRTALAGPSERSLVVGTLGVVVLIAGFVGIQTVRQSEAGSRPRVMHSTDAVSRIAGFGTLTPEASATLLFSALQPGDVAALSWRGGTVGVSLDKETLLVSHDSAVMAQVSLRGLDYVREVYGATATGDQGQEFLALLVRLRATGRRELLLIYDSTGALVHEELLVRTTSGSAPVLSSAGRSGGEQGFLLDLGEPLRYIITN